MTARDVVKRARPPFGRVVGFIMRTGKRVAVTAAGLALLLAGLVMLVTPGPGLLVIIAGLAVLATEYVWAERALSIAKDEARRARDRAMGRGRKRSGAGSSGQGSGRSREGRQ